MKMLRCTKKLLKELKTAGISGVPPAGPLGGWHANLLGSTDANGCCAPFIRYLNRIPMAAIKAVHSIDELRAVFSRTDRSKA